MTRCDRSVCENCTCGKQRVVLADNANFAPIKKPKRTIRRDPRAAAIRLEQRFKESMQILS